MFDDPAYSPSGDNPIAPGSPPEGPDPEADACLIKTWHAALDQVMRSGRDIGDVGRIDRIRALEDLKSAACALQAADTVELDRSRREADAAAGIPAAKQGKGVGREISLARRESPHRGGRLLGMARALVDEMPHTFAALQSGVLNEWRATILVRETACLSVEDRAAVDASVAGSPEMLEGVGNKALTAMAQQAAYALDPHAQVKRAAKAETGRHVSCRPAPDTMAWVGALLPVKAGVAVYAALTREADRLRAVGDDRSRGQIMADTLVERVTGKSAAQPVNYEIQLVMTDRTLLQGSSEPAYLAGYGIVPAQYARNLIRGKQGPSDTDQPAGGGTVPPGTASPGTETASAKTGTAPAGIAIAPAGGGLANGEAPDGRARANGAAIGGPPTNGPLTSSPPAPSPDTSRSDAAFDVWIRRLFTAPDTGQLVGMDSRARLMPSGLRRFIQVRDAICRTPWCDAPIRHFDHIIAWSEGGSTSAANGEGYCENCNLAKEADGWQARQVPGDRHTVEITAPTGHKYSSTAPALPGTESPVGTEPPSGTGFPSGTGPWSGTEPASGTGSPSGTESPSGAGRKARLVRQGWQVVECKARPADLRRIARRLRNRLDEVA
ncbi:HNH endonuclease [Arthrobacter sp. USHLN218]|uniref:HNH endonuclease n=1 Tax=Arthrobacter sp. USHLN218 TaxID=3081232 RepID=UPI00301AED34